MRNGKKRTVSARYAVNKLRKHYDAGTAEEAEAFLRKTGHVYVAGSTVFRTVNVKSCSSAVKITGQIKSAGINHVKIEHLSVI